MSGEGTGGWERDGLVSSVIIHKIIILHFDQQNSQAISNIGTNFMEQPPPRNHLYDFQQCPEGTAYGKTFPHTPYYHTSMIMVYIHRYEYISSVISHAGAP